MNSHPHSPRRAIVALTAALAAWACCATAAAQQATARQETGRGDVRAGETRESGDELSPERGDRDEQIASKERGRDAAVPKRRAIEPESEHYDVSPKNARMLRTAQSTIFFDNLIAELVDDLVGDVRELEVEAISPMALRRVQLTSNISSVRAMTVSSRVMTALQNSTEVTIKRCAGCDALRTEIEEGQWVLRRGITDLDVMRETAERLEVVAFLDLDFAYFPVARRTQLRAELVRATDGAVLWSQSYRADPKTAAIVRDGSRVHTRAQRLHQLEEKLEARPYFGYTAFLGGGTIPYEIGGESNPFDGGTAGIRLYEQFGTMQRWLFGINAEGFLAVTDALTGAFIQMLLQFQVNPPSLDAPVVRTGPAIGGFMIGNEGNSLVVEWTADAIFQFRLGLGASAFYYLPVAFAGGTIGGLGFKGRLTFNW